MLKYALAVIALLLATPNAFAQILAPTLAQAAANAEPARANGLWPLFVDSFDVFTVILILGSVAGLAMVFINLLEIREANILPKALAGRFIDLAKARRWDALTEAARSDRSFLSKVVLAAAERATSDATSIREAAEITASEESARWFRRIDILNLIGNLGPLVGLAGTVWGMILAFVSLGASGGQAGPADLSLGISKALFHTLLGLCLAIPCLFAYGLLRNRIDRLCTRATVVASEVVEHITRPA